LIVQFALISAACLYWAKIETAYARAKQSTARTCFFKANQFSGKSRKSANQPTAAAA
jgi:hypothetical protein